MMWQSAEGRGALCIIQNLSDRFKILLLEPLWAARFYRGRVLDCIAQLAGAFLRLGPLVLEMLDLVVDCRRQQLIPNPEAPDGLMLYEDY
jgi:hypothetical protein